MSKVIFREIIISLLVCLAVLLCLSALFYRFIPNNKVLPEKVTYQATEDIKNEINTNVQDNTDAIIKTYEITASDLEGFERTDQYKPGKANPFAPIPTDEEIPDGETNAPSGNISGESINTNTGSSTQSGGNVQNNQGGGSLFENGSSK